MVGTHIMHMDVHDVISIVPLEFCKRAESYI